MNEGASENSRSGHELRGDVRPERSRPVADQAVQVRRVDPRGRRNETMRVGIVLDCHRQAAGIVTVVSMRREQLRRQRDGASSASRKRYARCERETKGASTIQGSDRGGEVSRTQRYPRGPESGVTITPLVPLTRRQFLWSAAASVGSLRAVSDRSDVIWPELLYAQSSDGARLASSATASPAATRSSTA